MDRKYLGGICLLTAAVTMASCSSDEPISNDDNVVGESKQTISLAVANTGDNFISTRAARPLYSSEAKQDINKVKVVIYRLGDVPADATMANIYEKLGTFNLYGEHKIVAEKTFSPWMNSGVSFSYSNNYGHGRQASWTLSTVDQIKQEGVYMAYAVGYNDDEYTDLTTTSDFGALTKPTTDNTVKFTFPLSVKQNTAEGTNKGKIFEVFAGSAPFIVTEKTGNEGDPKTYEFDVALTLHRQVAGTIGYFTNIPVKGNSDHPCKTGATLRLVASNKCDNAVFAAFNYGFTGKTDESADNIKYVVNGWDNTEKTATKDAKFYGSTAADAYTVYEVALKDWFNADAGMDSNSDGILNEHDTWNNALSSTGAAVKNGCVLGGSFLFPFPLVADKATFQLQMLDDSNNIIRFWNIRLQTSTSSSDSQIGQKAKLVKSNGYTTDGAEENSINYSVLRNHLYNIGQKSKDDSTDDDNAQDLNKETLILRVNDNWEMVHQMDIF